MGESIYFHVRQGIDILFQLQWDHICLWPNWIWKNLHYPRQIFLSILLISLGSTLDSEQSENQGLIPRVFTYLFDSMAAQQLKVSCLHLVFSGIYFPLE